MIGLFCKRAYKRDGILQKRLRILRSLLLRSLLIVATPPRMTVSTENATSQKSTTSTNEGVCERESRDLHAHSLRVPSPGSLKL